MSIVDRTLEIHAATIARGLLEKEAVSGLPEAELAALVLRVLKEDRALELACEDEAKRLMQKHAADIARGNMDTGALFRKFKAQIAKEKGFTP
jgi:hypothetical protein